MRFPHYRLSFPSTVVVFFLCTAGLAAAQTAVPDGAIVPQAGKLVGMERSPMAPAVERFTADQAALNRRYAMEHAPERVRRMEAFYHGWRTQLRSIDFDALDQEGRIDHILLDNELRYRQHLLDRRERLFEEMAPLLPFAADVMDLQERRRHIDPVDVQAAAQVVAAIPDAIARTRAAIRTTDGDAGTLQPSPVVAFRTAGEVEALRRTLADWHSHYAGYDPAFTWRLREPHEAADAALRSYARFLRERVAGIREGVEEPVIGDPIGADALARDLEYEMIAYTPEELIAIAEREFAWGERELRRAAADMGFGDDWKAALEHVKTLHVEPGQQRILVRDLAREAVAFLRERDLVTVPDLAEEIWRLEMLSPEWQRIAPFFLGGEVVRVAFPTDDMTEAEKQMSLRSNNIHFSRAVVHHELIPGHHLQGFMNARYNTHRNAFRTPFWTEGWALWWEMLLWDEGFPQSPEDRMGMLFWRMHRAARILFSLNFHLENWTPEQAIDFLVERVGHERASATAEVRRSFVGTYSPLYQVAYMMGGLQFRALHDELVRSGRMTNREFHDAILRGGPMPVEMVRAMLVGEPLTRDHRASWRFADEVTRGR
jgi:uncharacterized protein (DUF885 family)